MLSTIGKNKKNILLVWISLFALISCSNNKQKQATLKTKTISSPPQYNVLIVSFDSLRADSLGIYGYNRNTSPNIDKFASNALIFKNAYTAGATTPTSFAAAFSGKYPFHSLHGDQFTGEPSIADFFRGYGYKTAFISDNIQLTPKRGYNKGFDIYKITKSNNDRNVLSDSIKILGNLSSQKFFFWIHFLSPHVPYDFRPASTHLYNSHYTGPYKKTSGRRFTGETAQELKRLKDLYDGEIYYADWLFKEILNRCNQLDLLDNTIIIITADHGEEFKEHGKLTHKSVYNIVTHIPLILYTPNNTRKGFTNELYSNIDLLPTLAHLISAPPPPNTSGIDIFNQDTTKHDALSVYMQADSNRYEISSIEGDNKLIYFCGLDRSELYNIKHDFNEQHDIAQIRSIEKKQIWESIRNIMGMNPCETISYVKRRKKIKEKMNQVELQRLKSLGYIK